MVTPNIASSQLSTWADLSRQYQTTIAPNSGNSRAQILELIQTVKRELAIERDQRLGDRH